MTRQLTAVDPALDSIDLHEIMRLIPHRYPFLLVDKIINIDANKSAVGFKNVTVNEPHFQGHFPQEPVMPGVLIIEGMAQTAGAIAIRDLGLDVPTLVFFMTIDGVKFRKPVVPGDVLEYHVTLIKKRGNICKYQCIGIVGGDKVAEAEVQAMLSPPSTKKS